MTMNRAEVGTSLEHFGLGVLEGKPTANIHFFCATVAEVVKVAGCAEHGRHEGVR